MLGRKKETITPCPEIMWTATQKKLLSAPLQIDLYSAIDLSEMILYHDEWAHLITNLYVKDLIRSTDRLTPTNSVRLT